MPAADDIYIWGHCHSCGSAPIAGFRYECRTCPPGPDVNLCERCYLLFRQGSVSHPSAQASGNYRPVEPHRFVRYAGNTRDACTPWLSVPESRCAPPAIPDGFVVRPEFRCGYTSFVGSYGFILSLEDDGAPAILITAFHIMGELMQHFGADIVAMPSMATIQDLPKRIDYVNLFNVYADNWVLARIGKATGMLVLADAVIGQMPPDASGDIAAFQLASSPLLRATGAAREIPEIGQPVWLACSGNGPRQNRTCAATVVDTANGALVYRFAPGTRKLRNTSGAPILNEKGEVVGINIGGGDFEEYHFGYANHVGHIRRHLTLA